MKISVIIPTLNEEQAIGSVVRAIPADRVHEVIVVDNGSTDNTAEMATSAGARLIVEPRAGYGSACLTGAKTAANADILVFMDGDRSDDPRELETILGPIVENRADLVIGSRLKGNLEKGAMPLHGRLGNHFIVLLLRLLYGVNITDIGSFRAIRAQTLFSLKMEQMTYGWPVEMVVKAARQGLRILSVPVTYRRRIGQSKVTGTIRGTILATYFLFLVPLKYLIEANHHRQE
ncbi:glycosyltransferase family 2 protein [Desulfosarcina sp.]|uniref:glycosyltransferase family 2 protein n=1 Tax=Desulfosarcina sp. TaxID=2027861 RepID=UPI0029A416EF|nr:glycosyltransferase family 2 protein [Desulfosarcina sp.]MDX2455389.1 glycosyltransferase family 2 protein [Desulfosarcina sp.]MDX2492907.1 glycosyltransferase family 2 protein [Desulfosarcina sp.]